MTIQELFHTLSSYSNNEPIYVRNSEGLYDTPVVIITESGALVIVAESDTE